MSDIVGYRDTIKSSDERAIIHAIGLLFAATNNDEKRKQIRDCGCVQSIIKLLDHSNSTINERACGTLLNLATDDEGREDLVEAADKVLKLIDTRTASKSDDLLRYGTGFLLNISTLVWEVILKNNGEQVFAKLVAHESEDVKINAIGAISGFVYSDQIAANFMKVDGCYKNIVNLLTSLKDEDSLTRVANVVWNLSICTDESRESLCKVGAVEGLLSHMTTDNETLLSSAIMALAILCKSEQVGDRVNKLKATSTLVDLIYNQNQQVAKNAASGVWNLSHHEKNIQQLLEADVLDPLLKQLETVDRDLMEVILGALITLCSSKNPSTIFRDKQGFQHLESLLSTSDEKNLLYAIILSAVLAYEPLNQEQIRECGALSKLLSFLKKRSIQDAPILEKTSGAILNLTLCESNKVFVRSAPDAINDLVELLRYDHPIVQQNVAGALWNLAQNESIKDVIRVLGGLSDMTTLVSGGQLKPRTLQGNLSGSIIDPDRKKEASNLLESNQPKVSSIPLEDYIGVLKDTLQNDEHLTDQEKKQIKHEIKNTIDWLTGDGLRADPPTYDKKKNQLRAKVEPLLEASNARKDFEKMLGQLRSQLKSQPKLSNSALEQTSQKEFEKIIQDAKSKLKNTSGNSATARQIQQETSELQQKMDDYFAKRNLQNFLSKIQSISSSPSSQKINPRDDAQLKHWCDQTEKWIKTNEDRARASDYEKMTKQLQSSIGSIKNLKHLADAANHAIGMRMKEYKRWGAGGPSKEFLYGSYLEQAQNRLSGLSMSGSAAGGTGAAKNYSVPSKSKYSVPSKQDEEDLKLFEMAKKKVSPNLQAKMSALIETKNQAKSSYGRVLEPNNRK
ncbi:armadillo repeat-containing kinesin-like protein [Acrasis kona]|uniref:Armadillo repeat-containing kinesin-like protein n=1 Tax=Acrasis kona TaxID=1008807 RepID=A0AAW2YN11_9EUKA